MEYTILLLSLALSFSANAMVETRILPQTADKPLADRDNPKKAFIKAAMEGDFEKFKQEFAKKENIDETYEGIFGWTDYVVRENLTALQWAIYRYSKAEWDINGRNFCNDRSKWESNLLEIIKFLLKEGANVNKMTKKCFIASDFGYSCHPLALAYHENLWDVFKLLLDFGAMLPISDLQWIDARVRDRTEYECALHRYKHGSLRPTYGKIDFKSISIFER